MPSDQTTRQEPPAWNIEISGYEDDPAATSQAVFDAVEKLISEQFPDFSGVVSMRRESELRTEAQE